MKREKFSASRYFVQRFTRIFPLLVVCVCLTGVIEWYIDESAYRTGIWVAGRDEVYYFWINLLGAGGFFGHFGSIAPAYTISYELLYYVLWGISRFVAGERVLLALVTNMSFAVGYCLLPASYVEALPNVLGEIFKQFILLIYLPWLIGVCTAKYLEVWRVNSLVNRIANWGWLMIVFVVLIGGKGFGMPKFATTLVSLIYYPILGVCFSLLIIRARVRYSESTGIMWKHLLGEMSYPLFLIHGPTMVFVGFVISSQAIELPFFAHLLLLIVGALTAASILVRTIERPVMQLRSYYFDKSINFGRIAMKSVVRE